MTKVREDRDRHNPAKPARKPRPQPARFVRLVVPPGDLASGVVRLAVGTVSTDYALRPILSQVGGRAFELVKLGVEADGEVYHICLTGAPGQDSCDCKGFCRWSRCKHRDALAALIAAGSLNGKGVAA
jgi:hypothetical protein